MSAGIAICEEAAFMDVDVFFRVVVPLLLIDECALLCITTISNDVDNHFDQLVHLPGPDGKPLLKQYMYTFVCPSCIAANLTVECKVRVLMYEKLTRKNSI